MDVIIAGITRTIWLSYLLKSLQDLLQVCLLDLPIIGYPSLPMRSRTLSSDDCVEAAVTLEHPAKDYY